MTDSYHNTTSAASEQLEQREAQAKSQEELIYEYFLSRPGMQYSPSQVQRYVNLTSAPLTSIRRAMTNLTKDQLLTKTDHQVTGPYNHPEYTWTLRTRPAPQQGQLL